MEAGTLGDTKGALVWTVVIDQTAGEATGEFANDAALVHKVPDSSV